MSKIILFLITMAFCLYGIAQQTIPMQKTASIKKDSVKISGVVKKQGTGKYIFTQSDKKTPGKDTFEAEFQRPVENKIFTIYGSGNVNNEQLEKFNSSGKFSCAVSLLTRKSSNLTFYLSFNKNATNNDSLLASTLIFPEIGHHSFLGTIEFAYLLKNKKMFNPDIEHFIVPFLEFSNKSIKVSEDTGTAKSTAYHFSTLNYTAGIKYLFHYRKTIDTIVHNVYFSLTGYFSYLNIPNEDIDDYHTVLKSTTLSDKIFSLGIKTAIQYNNFLIFADFRHVLGTDKRIPVRELRGFSSNIGIVFNAEIFGL